MARTFHPEKDLPLSILQAIILGITQGVTEFAPISSSGHLILVPWLFNWTIVNDPALNKTFDVALHMGTLVGALVYFRQDILRYLKAGSHSIAHASIATHRPAPRLGARDRHDPRRARSGPCFESTIQDNWAAVADRDRCSRSSASCCGGRPRSRARPRLGLDRRRGRPLPRHRAGARAAAGRLALGHHDDGRAAARASTASRAARFSFLLAIPIIAGAGVFKGVDLAQTGSRATDRSSSGGSSPRR